MRNKLAKTKPPAELVTLEQQVIKMALSEDAGGLIASALGVPDKQRRGFQLAYTLLPLNRAKECIDMAYNLATDGYPIDDIQSWLQRYERLAGTELPKWAKKRSRDYLKQVYDALEGESEPESGLTYILYEFKGFIYAVFCRTLMERYTND